MALTAAASGATATAQISTGRVKNTSARHLRSASVVVPGLASPLRRQLVISSSGSGGSFASGGNKKSSILFGREIKPPLPPSVDENDYDSESPACSVAYAEVDNDSHPTSSVLNVTVSAVPGVLRILGWLLNGLALDVIEAELLTDEDGADEENGGTNVVHIKMLVNEGYGKHVGKVKDKEGLEERLNEYMRFCTQAERSYHPVVEHCGIRIDNESDPKTTIITVSSEEKGAQSLLMVASTITGLGLIVKRARLKPPTVGGGARSGSVWEFNVEVQDIKKKLTNSQVQGLLYTLALVFNNQKSSKGFGDYMVEKMVNV
eukprot:CAMPEP_0197591502 /NCGR_PEP_ID=MMETSP1326-20131121/13481_1 /TAXON_ID=1155430 /ORGANISM="Genus nov. species nov., Strain RCC2288" /LENGTH=317 /DNA_ID=CAMNT_0043156989 /DNA_START=193 /DNA_END=1146 /DNA_ORIENTATION=+